jgi:hypothetical protein
MGFVHVSPLSSVNKCPDQIRTQLKQINAKPAECKFDNSFHSVKTVAMKICVEDHSLEIKFLEITLEE